MNENEGIKVRSFNGGVIVSTLVLAIVLFAMSKANYLVFHSLAEGFSILVTVLIYVFATKTFKYSQSSFFLFLGIAYLFIGLIDFFHLLSYNGMGVFPGLGPNPPTQLWMGARFLEVISLVLAPVFLKRTVSYPVTMVINGMLTSVIVLSILWVNVFPESFMVGQGLTEFKVIGEYFISLLMLAGIWHLYRNRSEMEKNLYNMMIASMAVTIISELSFTLYTDVYDVMNYLGHVFKTISFILIYEGVVKSGLENPYAFIFHKLKMSSITDELTGLYNRKGFNEFVETLAREVQISVHSIGILLMDIDNFKNINDSYGHVFGDEVLKQFAHLIKDLTRKGDIVCRLGGDEFILITKANEKELEQVERRLQTEVKDWIDSDERLQEISLSVGAVVWGLGQNFDIDYLIEQADRRMYLKKDIELKRTTL